ncbi:MAG: prolipoprotein diacylglyceryl transferase family protein [Chloroflexota bacterium]
MSTGLLAALVLDFDPYLRFGDRAVRWEILAVAAAVLVGIVVTALVAGRTPGPGQWIGEEELPEEEREGPWHLRRDDLLFILLGAVPGAVVLGRLGYGFLHLDYYGAQWRALLDPGQGSMELTLAVVGGSLTAVYVAALLDAPVARWLHVSIAPLLFVLGLGKAAQALGGSGQGDATAATWATAYAPPGPWGSPGAEIPAHPAQLYEAAMTAAVLLVIIALARLTPLRRADGRLFAVGIGLWALGRGFVASTWRDPDVLRSLNAGQLVCIVVAIAALGTAVVVTVARRRAPRPLVAP